MRILAAVLLAALVPVASVAQDGTPRPSAAPVWSIGAGVGSAFGGGLSSASLAIWNGLPSLPFGANASIERSLTARTWLVLGVFGAYSHEGGDDLPAPNGSELGTLSVAAGVRRVLTDPGAPLAFSVDGVVTLGAAWAEQDVGDSSLAAKRASGWVTGASAGFAVDRRLAEGLFLRIGSSVLSAEWTRVSGERADGSEPTVSQLDAGVHLAPYLQLRLLF